MVAASVLALPLSAFAQSAPPAFTISASPQYPVPYGTVSIVPASNLLDLSSGTFVVSVNGAEIYRGNAQPVAVTLGAGGSVTNVTGTFITGSTNYSQQLTIIPQDVALVVEPIASVPPLYLGKPLEPLEGSSRIVAVANMRTKDGTALDPTTLSYAWTIDGTAITSSSGIGKASIIAASPLQYRASTVSVVVTSPDGTLVGGDSVALNPQEASVRLYANNPLMGIRFDRALAGAIALTGTEESLYAATYSLPTSSGNPLLQWFLNGTSAQSGALITLRPTGQGAGTANVSLTATAGATTASANLSLSFGSNSGTNLFGL